MATFITVRQEGSELLRRNAEQTQANRLAKVESDEQRRTEQQAREVRRQALQQQGRDASGNVVGSGLRRRFRPDEPAATFLPGGVFGFIDLNNGYDYEPIDPYFKEENRIPANRPLKSYAVIRIVVASKFRSCVGTLASPADFFGGRESELASFLTQGGTIWINNEFKDCGIKAQVFNAYLSSVFGATIAFGDNFQQGGTSGPVPGFTQYEVYKSPKVYQPQSWIGPPFFYANATSSILGGIPLYANGNGAVCSFERIGRGRLVLTGDQDGTGQFPSITEGSKDFIQGLSVLK